MPIGCLQSVQTAHRLRELGPMDNHPGGDQDWLIIDMSESPDNNPAFANVQGGI